MDNFKEYIKSAGAAPLPVRGEIESLLRAYPWFTTARMVRAMTVRESGATNATPDSLLPLHQAAAPVPARDLMGIEPGEYCKRTERQIIEMFLGRDDHRIVPREDADADAEAGPEDSVEITVVTEELGRIYMTQGHWAQAIEVYEKLSLLFPEKSVYFAGIIGEIASRMNR